MMQARVLVLEDDPAIQRFIALTLNEYDLSLLSCGTLVDARTALATMPVDLLIMDMGLRDGSGIELLHWLRDVESGSVHVGSILVLSGGVDGAMQQRLLALGVRKVLLKPVSVGELKSSVEEALAPKRSSLSPLKGVGASDGCGPVEDFFAGNRTIFDSYRAACLALFPADVMRIDEALLKGETEILRHVAHNLKSVLRMLGYSELSFLAGELEQLTDCGASSALEKWKLLRLQLLRLAAGAIQIQGGPVA